MVPSAQRTYSLILFSGQVIFLSKSQTGALQRMKCSGGSSPLPTFCRKHLKTSQSPACCLLYQRVSGNLSESSLRYGAEGLAVPTFKSLLHIDSSFVVIFSDTARQVHSEISNKSKQNTFQVGECAIVA